MKILYHHRIASKDGQYVHVEELTNALKKQGHTIIMVAPSIAETSEFGSEGGFIKTLKAKMPKCIYELLEFFYSFYAYRKLARAVKRYNPDVLYERYNLFLPAGIWIKKRFKLPMLLEVNSPLFDERAKHDGVALKRFAKWSERYTWKNADRVLPVTQVLANIVEANDVPKENIVVIPNGIDLETFHFIPDTEQAKQKLGIQDSLVLGFTGFMRDWHGLDRLVDIIADNRSQNIHLLLVGDGPARESIEEKAKQLKVTDCVTITGIINRDKIADYVSAFDIALQPDVTDYASPLKLFEYMALGRAIIAPDKENIKEILIDRENALLFRANDEASFINSVRELCEDKTLRTRLSENARNTILETNLTWDNNAHRVVSLFEELLRKAD